MSENSGTRLMVRRTKFWLVWLGSPVAFVLIGWLLTATWSVHDITAYIKLRSHATTDPEKGEIRYGRPVAAPRARPAKAAKRRA
jgi:hypothetical protein